MPDAKTNSQPRLIYRIAVPSPLRRLFDYLPPPGQGQPPPPGVRVRVPFGKRRLIGILVECARHSELDPKRLRAASEVLDQVPLFSPGLFSTLRWACNYYLHAPGDVFSSALPVKLRRGDPVFPETETWHVIDSSDSARQRLQRAPKQAELFALIANTPDITREAILARKFSGQLLRQLQDKQLITARKRQLHNPGPFDPDTMAQVPQHRLNKQQVAATRAIARNLDSFACFLLDGITGSGKTEVYMQLMYRQLRAGKQCLVLVPEIGLTPQTIARFQQRFQCPTVTVHSGLTDSERMQAWAQAGSGHAGIIIGTRSAVFTPLANPGLIIVDEEHDSSLKQQEGFRYSARDLAVVRGKEEGVTVILGSATPSLESLHNAGSGKFTHLCLDRRAGEARPASMRVIDIAEQVVESGFSDIALQKTRQHLHAGNQVLAFINRRGFAPMLHCLTCGWVAECDHCIARFTLHSRPPALRCHHCGQVARIPLACPHCASRELTSLGQGTQKIETFLEGQFPEFPVIRIDRDSTRGKHRFHAMLDEIGKGRPGLLLGTQMLAKGHHFPNVTLVVIIDADSGLFSADFRGQEQMAQTIVQVAGRAGRVKRPGEVLIQSRHAAHAVLQSLATLPYRDFARQLLAERDSARMPPFAHLALLRADSPDAAAPLGFLARIDKLLADFSAGQPSTVERLGPLPAPMEKRAGRFRGQLLLKSSKRGQLQFLLQRLIPAIEALKPPPRLRWSLDVDPLDMI